MQHLSKKTLAGALALAIASTGCADMSATQRGTATGAGAGAALGALIGGTTGSHSSGRTAGGALIGAAAGAVIGNIWSTRMENQKRAMEQATQGTGVQVSKTDDNRLRLEIPSDISFDTGRADIKSNFRPILDRFAATLNDNPAATVSIIGHTDSTGSDAINQPLSIDRAANARDYLAARGVSPTRIVVEGKGSREPVASNNDDSGRARNRRVEIFVAEPQSRG
jgi:outer membrane protein OmpA-like peptidoglycan-associated protein